MEHFCVSDINNLISTRTSDSARAAQLSLALDEPADFPVGSWHTWNHLVQYGWPICQNSFTVQHSAWGAWLCPSSAQKYVAFQSETWSQCGSASNLHSFLIASMWRLHWLYVCLWENNSVSHLINYPSKQFPNELIVSIPRLQSSSKWYDVHLVYYGPI